MKKSDNYGIIDEKDYTANNEIYTGSISEEEFRKERERQRQLEREYQRQLDKEEDKEDYTANNDEECEVDKEIISRMIENELTHLVRHIVVESNKKLFWIFMFLLSAACNGYLLYDKFGIEWLKFWPWMQ